MQTFDAAALVKGGGGAWSVMGQQWGARQTTGSAGTAYTYHQTFTVERQARRFRFKLLNANANAMTVNGGAVAVSEKLGTGSERYTPSTGTWVPITWDGGSTSVVVAAGTTTRPAIKWSDWIDINTIAPTDGTDLPVVMARFELPTGQFSIGNYSFAAWAATSGINDGRFLYTFRDAGAFASSNQASMPGTAYNNPFMLGFEYEAKGEAFTFAAQGDSITEGAVNGSAGNFGNGWFWQTIVALRAANPDIAIGYVNNGIAGSSSDTFIQRLVDFENAGCHYDAMLYSPFSPNDGTPTLTSTTNEINRIGPAIGVVAGKPVILWTPCVNTAAAWDATADGYRLDVRTATLGYENGISVRVVDIESDVSNGATPARFKVTHTTDGTHPNEVGYADMADSFEPVMQDVLEAA